MPSKNRATAATAFDVAMDVLGGVRKGNGAVETLRGSPPSVLRRLCERMGATYIKVGSRVTCIVANDRGRRVARGAQADGAS